MNQCVALIIEKAPTLQKRNFGAKIQNGYKILSIDTYYKGKLAYPHFSTYVHNDVIPRSTEARGVMSTNKYQPYLTYIYLGGL